MRYCLHICDSIFAPQQKRTLTPSIGVGVSVAAAVDAAIADMASKPAWWAGVGSAVFVLNGDVYAAEQAQGLWLEEGDIVRVAPAASAEAPGDPGTIFLAALAVLSTVASTLIISNSLRVPPATSSDPEQRRFGFGRFSSDAAAGDVLQVVLGYHPRYGGKVISQLPIADAPDGNARSKVLIDLGYGPVKRIGQWTTDVDNVLVDSLTNPRVFFNDDQPISQFKGCKVSVRMGTANQKAIAAFADTERLREVGVGGSVLANTSGADRTGSSASGEAVLFSSTDVCDQLRLRIRFPRGLVALSNSGQRNARRVQYRYRTRLQAGPGAWSAWTVQTVERADDAEVVSVVRTADLADPPALVDVQVERVTAEPSDAAVVDQMVFDQVVEIVRSNNNYAGRALLALELVASDQLQSIPRVSVDMEGYAGLRVWDGVSDPDSPVFTTGYSANPAALALEFLTNKKWGMGNVYSDANVDLVSLFEWWSRGDASIACQTRAGNRPRYRCNLRLEEARYGIDWLRTICDAGNAMPIPSGTQWRFVENKARSVATEKFTDGSIAVDDNGTPKFRYTREATKRGLTRPNQLTCQFASELADGRAETIVYPRDGELWFSGGTPEPVSNRSFRSEGVTDPDQVWVRMVLEMKQLRGLSRTVNFETVREIVAVQAGDRIDVACSVPGWGLASGRLQAGATTTTLKLDRSVVLESMKTYVVEVVHQDNSTETRTISSPAGTYAAGTALTVSSAFTTTPAEFEEYALGEVDKAVKPFIATAVRPQIGDDGNLSVSIEAIEYDASVYDPTPGDIDLPDYSSLGTIDQAPGPLLELRATERVRNGLRVVDLAWSQAAVDRARTGSFRVYRRTLGTTVWVQLAGITSSLSAAVIELGDLDQGYQFVAVAVSPLGAALSPEDPRHPVSTIVYGLSSPPPPAPANPTLTNTGGNTYALEWDPVQGAVEYQVLAGGDTTSRPNTGAEDCLVLARTIEPRLENLELPPGRSCRFWIRSAGPSGRLSWSAAEISISSPATPIGESVKDTEVFDLSSDGTLSNLTWDATDSRLELTSPASPGVWTSDEIDTGSNTMTEITLRPATANDAADFVLSDGPFTVPSIAADQWGVVTTSPLAAGMLMPPWPDNEQTWLFEVRTSEDDVVYTDWEPLAFGTSISRSLRYYQVRATLTRAHAPYRPALRGLAVVTTH